MNKEWNNVNYFDIFKGIGILSIVVGHSCFFAGNYVYSYHLALFFFISGFLYNEKKYGYDPFLNFANRFKNNYSKYVLYAIIISFIHSIIIGVPFNFYNFRNYTLNSALFNNTEPLYGATWFVIPLILSSSIFGGIIYYGNIIKNKTHSSFFKNLIIILLGIFCCILGYERMLIKIPLPMRLDVALFVIPVFLIAYFLKYYIKDFEKYLKWYIAIPFFLLSIFLTYKMEWIISIVSQQATIFKFYTLAIIGIYQCMYLTKLIKEKFKYIAKVLSFIGKYTFEIMAFHFSCFKIIDIIYSKITGLYTPTVLETFPITYQNLWPIYVLVGCLVPPICTSFLKYNLKKYLYHS